jgi:hypothetical protein
MGADLYIESITAKAQEEFKPEFDEAVAMRDAEKDPKKREELQERVSAAYDKMYPNDGYFRDSYNGTSLFRALGLSWWGCGYIDEEGYISPQNAQKLLDDIKKKKVPKITVEYVDDGVEEWQKYFEEKKARFEKFLETAIEMQESILASV